MNSSFHVLFSCALVFFLVGCATPQKSAFNWQNGFDTSPTPVIAHIES